MFNGFIAKKGDITNTSIKKTIGILLLFNLFGCSKHAYINKLFFYLDLLYRRAQTIISGFGSIRTNLRIVQVNRSCSISIES